MEINGKINGKKGYGHLYSFLPPRRYSTYLSKSELIELKNIRDKLPADKAKIIDDRVLRYNLGLIIDRTEVSRSQHPYIDLSDLLSSSFEAVYKAWKDWSPEEGEFSTIAAKYISNAHKDLLKFHLSQKRNPLKLKPFPAQISDKRLESLDKRLEREEEIAFLQEALNHLSLREQLVIRLRYEFERSGELTLQEISDVTGIPVSTVSYVEHTALRKLRNTLGSNLRLGKLAHRRAS